MPLIHISWIIYFIHINICKTVLLPLLDDSFAPIWSYENNDLDAKSLTFRYDGTVLVCAEKIDDGISYIHFLKVSNGTLSNGDTFFKIYSFKND